MFFFVFLVFSNQKWSCFAHLLHAGSTASLELNSNGWAAGGLARRQMGSWAWRGDVASQAVSQTLPLSQMPQYTQRDSIRHRLTQLPKRKGSGTPNISFNFQASTSLLPLLLRHCCFTIILRGKPQSIKYVHRHNSLYMPDYHSKLPVIKQSTTKKKNRKALYIIQSKKIVLFIDSMFFFPQWLVLTCGAILTTVLVHNVPNIAITVVIAHVSATCHGKITRRRLRSVLTAEAACQSTSTATFTAKFLRMCLGGKEKKKKQRLCEFALLLLIWWKSHSLCPCALSRKTFSAALNGSDKPTSQSMNPTVRPLQTEAQTEGLCGLIVIAQDNRLRRTLRVGEPNRMEAPRRLSGS